MFADEHNYKMLMNADVLGQLTQVGLPDKGIAPINIFDRPSIAPYKPLQHIYGRYSQTIDQSLYFTESSKGGLPFSELDRLKLVGTIIESRPGCEPIKFERLTKRGNLTLARGLLRLPATCLPCCPACRQSRPSSEQCIYPSMTPL